jgi:hypothetical protein
MLYTSILPQSVDDVCFDTAHIYTLDLSHVCCTLFAQYASAHANTLRIMCIQLYY